MSVVVQVKPADEIDNRKVVQVARNGSRARIAHEGLPVWMWINREQKWGNKSESSEVIEQVWLITNH